MISPLKVYKDLAKKYDVTPDIDLTPMAKLSYLETQKQEIQHVLWRSLTDAIHATRLQESDNEVLKAKGNNNYAQHVNEVQQFVGAIRMLNKFIEELKEEYPELSSEE
jgi:hypothetical protein